MHVPEGGRGAWERQGASGRVLPHPTGAERGLPYASAVQVLLLGNSQDLGEWFSGGPKRHEIAAERLSAEFGEPVEIILKPYWPTDRMPEMTERWITETRPDMMYINVTAFPFAYESLPLRCKRVLGRFGPAIGNAGLRFADSKRWSHNALFRTARRYGQALIGGDTHFTCEEVVERTSATIRAAIRHENVFLVVEGPLGRGEPELTRRQRERKERRRLQVHSALRDLCNELHVHYIGSDEPLPPGRQHVRGETVGDGTHFNAEGHARLAEDLTANLSQAWRARLDVDADAGLKPASRSHAR